MLRNAKFFREIKDRRTFRPVADHYETGFFARFQNFCEDLDTIRGAFHGAKIRYVNEELFSVWREFAAKLGIRRVRVVIWADEIRYHLDLVKIKGFDRRLFKKFGNGRDAVRLLQAVPRDRQIAAVSADKRYVRP